MNQSTKLIKKIEAKRLRATTFAIAIDKNPILPFLKGNKNYFAFSW